MKELCMVGARSRPGAGTPGVLMLAMATVTATVTALATALPHVATAQPRF